MKGSVAAHIGITATDFSDMTTDVYTAELFNKSVHILVEKAYVKTRVQSKLGCTNESKQSSYIEFTTLTVRPRNRH